MARMILGIDGTGTEWFSRHRESYAAGFRHSHVRRLCDYWRGPSQYYEGPKLLGLDAKVIADEVAARARQVDPSDGVVLTGYSRGGAAAILVAQALVKTAVPVHALLLFDAVDRSVMIGSTIVPKNVALVVHAMRHPDAGSREEFGNCGLVVESPGTTRYVKRRFMGTHGALGGVPWPPKLSHGNPRGNPRMQPQERWHDRIWEGLFRPTNITPAADALASATVWGWMQEQVRTELGAGLGI